MPEASIQEQSPHARVAPHERILEHRYDLYCRAHDALTNHAGANAVLGLYAHAKGCRRAAESIALAEAQVENGFPKVALEHIGSKHGECVDCTRAACLTVGEIAVEAEIPERVVA